MEGVDEVIVFPEVESKWTISGSAGLDTMVLGPGSKVANGCLVVCGSNNKQVGMLYLTLRISYASVGVFHQYPQLGP